ncbi:MAG: amidohydrolase [Sphingobium sp.]|nr:amidohydrolase [Sphingobium sp.]
MTNFSRRALLGAQPKAARSTLIRGADLLTMDTQLGEMPGTDLLIEDGLITKIGKGLKAPAGAQIIDAKGMILMPGMVDSHRHTWETPFLGELVKTEPKRYSNYIPFNNQRVGVCMTADDVYLGNWLGGTIMIDGGVTSVLDQAHVIHTAEKGDAAGKGLQDSGIGGVFCFQITHSPTYGAGDTLPAAQAAAEFGAGADVAHLAWAKSTRDKYFTDKKAPLRFGIGLSGLSVGPKRTIDNVAWELEQARALSPFLMTLHGHTIMHLEKAGLLGADMHVSHGNGLSDEELAIMAKRGVKLGCSTMGEYAYDQPQIHGRARAAGVSVGIGMDVPVALCHDYFEHTRNSFWSLYRSPQGTKLAEDYTSTDVLAFATSLGAKSLGIGDETGSLTIGKRADLVLLNTGRIGFAMMGSLADRVVNFAHWQDIDSVWVAGTLRKHKGAMIGVDWGMLKKKAHDMQARVIPQAESIIFT